MTRCNRLAWQTRRRLGGANAGMPDRRGVGSARNATQAGQQIERVSWAIMRPWWCLGMEDFTWLAVMSEDNDDDVDDDPTSG